MTGVATGVVAERLGLGVDVREDPAENACEGAAQSFGHLPRAPLIGYKVCCVSH